MEFVETGWEIEGSAGGNARVGTPVVRVEVGAGHIVLPIKNTASGDTVRLSGAGGGLAVGASISLPFVNVTYSAEAFPSTGLGKIYAGPDRPQSGTYRAGDFSGGLLVHTAAAGKQISASVSCATWLSDPVEVCMARLQCSRQDLVQIARNASRMILSGGVTPAGASRYQLERFINGVKAIGFFAGSNLETQLLGMSADMFYYRVSA
ncbi:MAG: hypothetical protein LAT63_10230 [Marinobacter sp.]|nr:hypothetical protein [Marinobacter sp.]